MKAVLVVEEKFRAGHFADIAKLIFSGCDPDIALAEVGLCLDVLTTSELSQLRMMSFGAYQAFVGLSYDNNLRATAIRFEVLYAIVLDAYVRRVG